MKKVIISALAIVLTYGSVMAQEKTQEHKKHHKEQYGKMAEKLNLSQQQKDQMKTLNDEFRKQMEELKKNDNITVKEQRTRREELAKNHRERIQSILTQEQKDQFEKMKKEHHDGAKGKTAKTKRSGKNYGEGRMEKMNERLNLSTEQSEKLKTLHSGMSEKIKNIRSNESLTQEQKKEQVKELMKKQKEEMKSILTEEQLKKMDEMKSNRDKKVK
jgi:Spy/CpxP family protein refolding chaperone